MQRTVTAALAAWLACGLAAQEGGATAANPARAALDALVARYDAAVKEWSQAMKEMQASDEYKKAREARDAEAAQKIMATVAPVDRAAFGKEALQLADQFAGSQRLPFYGWAIANSFDQEVVQQALATIERDHLKDPQLAAVLEKCGSVARLLGAEPAVAFFERVAADNPDALARAWAMYWGGTALSGRDATAEQKAKAEQMLADGEKLAEGTPLADRIAAPRFQRERLQIGKEIPDIEGVDTDGTPFKLSDYRGKVVVLDFWGFW